MTLQQLKYFRVMADMLHYTQAAKLLYISQPSLSYSLSELEKELGAPLFGKQGKRTVLTKYGEAFLPFAKTALDNIQEGARQIEKMLMPASLISLGYIYSLSFDFLPKMLTGFCNLPDNQEVSFNFFQGLNSAILSKLQSGELELALSIDMEAEGVDFCPVFEQELFLIVPVGHHLTKQEKVVLADLKDESFVTISPNSNLRRQLDNIFKMLDATPRITFEAEECNAMASFVSARFGVAIMPEIPALHSYKIEVLPIDDLKLTRKIHLGWMKSRPLSPAAEKFRDYLVKEAQKSMSPGTAWKREIIRPASHSPTAVDPLGE